MSSTDLTLKRDSEKRKVWLKKLGAKQDKLASPKKLKNKSVHSLNGIKKSSNKPSYSLGDTIESNPTNQLIKTVKSITRQTTKPSNQLSYSLGDTIEFNPTSQPTKMVKSIIQQITKPSNQPHILNNKFLYTSKGLSHFSKRLKSTYNLTDITSTILNKEHEKKHCIFFGLYETIDLTTIESYKGPKYLIWGGSDIDITFDTKKKYTLITKIKQIPNVQHLSISKSITKRLNNLEIPSIEISFNLCSKNLYKKLSNDNLHFNDKIYIYNGYRPGVEHIYGEHVYKQVVCNVPEFEYIYSNQLKVEHDNMFSEIYGKCFLGLRLTKEDGNANTIQEMDECNIPVIFNEGSTSNCIPWQTSASIELSIRKVNVEQFVSHIKNKYSSILLYCTDYPGFGGAATNTNIIADYLTSQNINNFSIYTHSSPMNMFQKNSIVTTIDNFIVEYNKYNDVHKFDLVITRNYISPKIANKLTLPIYFLIPGIFGPNLDKYYFDIDGKQEMDKYINKRILKTCKIATKVYCGHLGTKKILKDYYNIDSSILCFNHIPFINKKLILPLACSNFEYHFGIIQSDFERNIKNIDTVIKKLINTGEKIILIGSNSTKYLHPNITNVPLTPHNALLKYYPKIKYVINDSYYEACCNVLLEAKYYSSTPIRNLKYLFNNLDNYFTCRRIIQNKPILLIEDIKYTMHDIINLNELSSIYAIYRIKKQNYISSDSQLNIIYCKDDTIYPLIKYYLASKYKNIYIYLNNHQQISGVYSIDIPENLYKMLSSKSSDTFKLGKRNKLNIGNIIKSTDIKYKNLIKESVLNNFMNNFMKLVFCCDRNYVLGLITAINSIIQNTKHLEQLIFHICVPLKDLEYMTKIFKFYGMDEHKFNHIFITFDDINLDNITLTKDGNHLKSIGNFMRLNVGEIFDTTIIYIDSDLVFSTDIYELNYLKLYNKNNIIAGIESDTNFGTILNKGVNLNNINLDKIDLEKKIINTGIYVLNCNLWNKFSVYQRIMNILSYHNNLKGGLFRCFTMSLLNLALYDKTEYFMFHKVVIDLGWKQISNNVLNSAHILDWSGNAKPWLLTSVNSPYSLLWDKCKPRNILTANVIISHPLNKIGGAQNFIKYLVKNAESNYFIIFHGGSPVFKLDNVMEFNLDENLIYSVLKNIVTPNIIFNNSNWLLGNSIIDWLVRKGKTTAIVHNEFSPVIKFILDKNIDRAICVNNKIVHKLRERAVKEIKLILPITFDLKCDIVTKEYNPNNIYFTFVGRYCKYKYVDLLIKIFTGMGPRVKLLLVSDLHIMDSTDNITMLVNPNMDMVYKKTNFLVSSSVTEGMPCTILEGLNYGIPYVGVGVGGISEIIKEGITGFLVDTSFMDKYKDILYFDNFDTLLNEFIYYRKRVEEQFTDIINNIINFVGPLEYKRMSDNCLNLMKNVHNTNLCEIKKLII
jgi:lipopolysaccharide biosynthesis glycosyltransferase